MSSNLNKKTRKQSYNDSNQIYNDDIKFIKSGYKRNRPDNFTSKKTYYDNKDSNVNSKLFLNEKGWDKYKPNMLNSLSKTKVLDKTNTINSINLNYKEKFKQNTNGDDNHSSLGDNTSIPEKHCQSSKNKNFCYIVNNTPKIQVNNILNYFNLFTGSNGTSSSSTYFKDAAPNTLISCTKYANANFKK